ncbi:MAG: zinc metalloprotease HtpX [Candidatus Omnitrophica bacterium]|nr:zinc metalloprotease HtpX [Candidatus Omnitrophota bacterium]MDD5737271.1 zinc metalloprotease HtpX [Candidatus Omnitrophota bacterium]
MSYSFVDIEKQKTWVIKTVFVFLLAFYFVIAEILWLVTKAFFSGQLASALTGRAPLFVPAEALFVFAVSFLLAYIHWYFSTKDMIPGILTMLDAHIPDKKDSYHRVFKNVVDEVSVATGGIHIDCYVIPVSGMNAFAISDGKGVSVIGITEGLLSRLNRSQLEAVVGHEAAHIASGDSFSTTVICSLFGIYAALLDVINRLTLRDSSDRDDHGINVGSRFAVYLIIVSVILALVQQVNLLLNMFISRQREYRADAVAVRLTRNPIALAESLYIISRGWRGVGAVPSSLAPLFIMNTDLKAFDESEGLFPDLLSTHPPVRQRLAVLLDMAHADLAGLKKSIRPLPKVPADTGKVPPEEVFESPVRDWILYKNNSWQGPFTMADLLSLGIDPSSWVSNVREGVIKHAAEDAALTQAIKARSAGKATAGRDCPRCKQPLAELLYEGAPVLECGFCAGICAKSSVVSRVLARENYSFSQEVKDMADSLQKVMWLSPRPNYYKITDPLDCPTCGKKMYRGFFSYGLPVEIDRCPACDSIWFDRNELEILQHLIEKNRLLEIGRK